MDPRLNLPSAGLTGIPAVSAPAASPAAPAAPVAAPAGFGTDGYAATAAGVLASVPTPAPAVGAPPAIAVQPAPAPDAQQPVDAQPAMPGLDPVATLKQSVDAQLAALEAAAQSGQVDDSLAARYRALGQIQAALEGAKTAGLPEAAQGTVQSAVSRLGELTAAIAQGQDPDAMAPEIFVIKHVLADPTRAGSLGSVTTGAQVLALVEDNRAAVAQALAQPGLQPEQQEQLQACAMALNDVEAAIERAKLTALDPDAEARAQESLARLGDFVAGLSTGESDPNAIYAEAQTVADPTQTPSPETVATGQSVLDRIAGALKDLKQKLLGLDDKVLAGTPEEAVAGQRARLMERGEALSELAAVVKRAKVAQADPKARREVEGAITRADAIAKALEAGEPVAKYRAEIFALNQIFADPAGSKDNASVQSAAAGIQVIGQAESNALKAIEAAEARIAKGEAASKSDAERAKAWRQHEDLETMRHALEGLDYTGLTNAQEAQGAQILDRARAIALKVAGGETYAQNEAAFKQVIADFNALKKAAPKPTPTPTPTPKPTPKPTPVPPKPLTPGGTYTVRQGDYLRAIAKRELGDANRYKEIVQLSKARYPSLASNPDLIFPGWQLTLPKK